MVTVTMEGLGVHLGPRKAVSDVTATLHPGTLIGIIGPNGAGKSTLVRAMLGLIPATGRIMVDGEPVSAIPRGRLARSIAYLPQGQTLHWPLTVERLVALGRLPHLAPFSRIGDVDRAAIDGAMGLADVEHLRGRLATELSGGERARVLLARALAVEAAGLVADEPLAALDPGHQIEVMTLLRRQAEAGALVVTVLHDLTMAARHCDRLLLLHRGRLAADGPPEEVLTAERLADVYGIRAWIGEAEGRRLVVPIDQGH